jgi:hypothetical protein
VHLQAHALQIAASHRAGHDRRLDLVGVLLGAAELADPRAHRRQAVHHGLADLGGRHAALDLGGVGVEVGRELGVQGVDGVEDRRAGQGAGQDVGSGARVDQHLRDLFPDHADVLERRGRHLRGVILDLLGPGRLGLGQGRFRQDQGRGGGKGGTGKQCDGSHEQASGTRKHSGGQTAARRSQKLSVGLYRVGRRETGPGNGNGRSL